MKDIFENIILCKDCGRKMEKGITFRDGFSLRYVYCPNCKAKIWHPQDIVDYEQFRNLKKKQFKVKLRIIGNSYAITLPKEIINFIKDVEKEFNIKKPKDEVKLMLDNLGKLSLVFEDLENKLKEILES